MNALKGGTVWVTVCLAGAIVMGGLVGWAVGLQQGWRYGLAATYREAGTQMLYDVSLLRRIASRSKCDTEFVQAVRVELREQVRRSLLIQRSTDDTLSDVAHLRVLAISPPLATHIVGDYRERHPIAFYEERAKSVVQIDSSGNLDSDTRGP